METYDLSIRDRKDRVIYTAKNVSRADVEQAMACYGYELKAPGWGKSGSYLLVSRQTWKPVLFWRWEQLRQGGYLPY